MQQKSSSDGGKTSYYQISINPEQIQDLIEYNNMNFSEGNMFKAVWRLGSKKGVSKEYDLKKIIWFAERELKRIK